MPNISQDRQDLNAIARYAYGSGLFGEGEKGGRGNMGLLKGSDGRLRVIKFNTHRGEGGGAVSQDQIVSSNFLRDQLLTLARNFGKSDEAIQRIRAELGLAQDDRQPQTLLTRKVVATVVKLIDQNIWQNVRRTDDGTAEFDLSALKSRSGNMEFSSVQTERLGLETHDAVGRNRRNAFMSKTVADAIKALELESVCQAMSPTALRSFRFAVDETLKQWQESRQSDEVENELSAPDVPGQEMGAQKRRVKRQLENMVRVNFVRMLIICGKTDDARAYVRAKAKTENAWATFRPLATFCKCYKQTLSGDGMRKRFLMELSRYCQSPDSPLVQNGPAGDDIRDPMAAQPKAFGSLMAAAAFSNEAEERRIRQEGGGDADLQERQKLWDEIDRMPKGFLPKRSIDAIKSGIAGFGKKFSDVDVRRALDVYKTQIPREQFVERLAVAYGRVASRGGTDPRPKLDALLTKLQAAVFVNRLQRNRRRDLTLEECVAWLEQNPTFLLRLERREKLAQANPDLLKRDIKKQIVSRFKDNDKVDSFGGEQTGVYMRSIREYDDGELTVNGEGVPTVPSEGFVMPKVGSAGTEGVVRAAATETLQKKIDNLAQRKLVSFLLSMADGLQNAVDDVIGKLDGVGTCIDLMLEFPGGGLGVLENQSRRFCDMTFGDDGSIRLKMTVGSGLMLQQFLGVPLVEKIPLVNDSYDVEITIPRPGEDFAGGCPAFTIDSISLSDVDTQM